MPLTSNRRCSINWEECSSQNCWLNSLAPQVPQVGTCNQGRIPPYSVTVTAPQDAQVAIQFAVTHKIKIVVKNTGHEVSAILVWRR